ncbi:MAG: undecaprenyl-diphosphate phosphatase, partial [Chloroflexota bacterium]
ERLGKQKRDLSQISAWDALWVGLFQAISIFPGISRSGSTIAGGMLLKFDRTSAARFAFLMSVPVMLGAGLVATVDLLQMPDAGRLLPAFAPGFLAAGVTGYLSIRWLIDYLCRRPLTVFAIYCTAAGLLTITLSLMR